MDFSNQVAVVTGGARGIGWATAQALAAAGAAVAIVDIDAVEAQAAAARLGARSAIGVSADVSDEESVRAMIARVIEWHPRIDILVHCAGIGLEKLFLETSLEEWNRLIRVDLTGTFICCREVASEMVSQRYGRIVTLASTAGVRGGTGRAAYGAAKGGVITLTKVMAVELAPFGVTVNTLAPGAIETELVRRMHSDTTRRVYKRAIPMDRYGTAEEVAASALFLASRDAGYITGQVLGIDGGFMAAGVMHKE